MAKNIVFCADGTWNNEEATSSTNVLKIFKYLSGEIEDLPNENHLLDVFPEMERKEAKQVAKYINGVGNQPIKIQQIFCGAFGAGVIARIIRGYTFISRNYEPGDDIYLVGFSRGAYTVRALAGMIVAKGLLNKSCYEVKGNPQSSKDNAYEFASETWFEYKSKGKNDNKITRLAHSLLANLFANGITSGIKALFTSDKIYHKNVKIKCLAVFDTVGSHGIPRVGWKDGENFVDNNLDLIDQFQFADLTLSDKVEFGFHAIARDEKRISFMPTLWNSRVNIDQEVFAGAHADTGGGYPNTNHESELSDIALDWMVNKLKSIGLRLTTSTPIPNLNPLGPQHQEWANITNKLLTESRNLTGISVNSSVNNRINKSVDLIKVDFPTGSSKVGSIEYV